MMELMRRCPVCRVAVMDGEIPYILPLNFGLTRSPQGELTLYFHGARDGKKTELFAAAPMAGFELDLVHDLVPGKSVCQYSIRYESICGYGRLEELTDREEKRIALSAVMAQLVPDKTFEFYDANVDFVRCWKLTVKQITCKRRV